MDKNDGILVRLDIGDIVAILQKLSPSNKQEERIAEKLKWCLAFKLFGIEESEQKWGGFNNGQRQWQKYICQD